MQKRLLDSNSKNYYHQIQLFVSKCHPWWHFFFQFFSIRQLVGNSCIIRGWSLTGSDWRLFDSRYRANQNQMLTEFYCTVGHFVSAVHCHAFTYLAKHVQYKQTLFASSVKKCLHANSYTIQYLQYTIMSHIQRPQPSLSLSLLHVQYW